MSHLVDFSLFRRNRNFCLLYLGQFISFIGTMITGVALPYQIYHHTHSTLLVGLLSLAQLLPLLFTALLGGILADRYQRRKLLLIAESLLAGGCLLLAWNAALDMPRIGMIFVIAALMSAITGLHRPALDSITQQLVAKNDFSTAASLATFRFGVGMIAAPAIGGLLLAHFGIAATFLVDFVSFVVSLGALVGMSHIPKPVQVFHESAWRALKQGFQYAVSRQELMGSYVVDITAMIFGMPSALFPAIAQTYGGARTLGLLYSAPAVGALVVAITSGWVRHVKRHGVAIAVAAAMWGVAIILFGLVHNLLLALFFLALAGAFDAVSGIFRSTLWNETIPSQLRGRLAGIEIISYLSGPKLGDTEAGLVAAAFGITVSIVSGGVLCVVGVAVCCYALPKFWHYRSGAVVETSTTETQLS